MNRWIVFIFDRKSSLNSAPTSNKHDGVGQDSGNRTDEESLLTSDEDEDDDDDDERREERTTDDDLLRTTDDDDGNTVGPTVNSFNLSPTKRKVCYSKMILQPFLYRINSFFSGTSGTRATTVIQINNPQSPYSCFYLKLPIFFFNSYSQE